MSKQSAKTEPVIAGQADAAAEEQIHTSSDPNFKDTLESLSQPLVPSQIKSRPGAKNRNGDREAFTYTPWYEVAEILDSKAPDWSHSIKDIRQIGEIATVIVAITIQGVTREGVGTGSILSETGIKKAEHDALKRAAVKFGIARELYKKESNAIDDNARRFESDFDINNPPRPAAANSLADMVTTKQLGLIRAIGRKIELDVEADCQTLLGCSVDQMNKRAASWFIEYLRKQEEGYSESNRNLRELNAGGNVTSISDGRADHVSPATRGRLILENGGVETLPWGYLVTDTIRGEDCKFKVTKDDDAVRCECGDYKTHANTKGEPNYDCAHKLAVSALKAVSAPA